MKKGLLGLVVIALTVVGCQNYDDQFDDLNKKIASLSDDVSNLSSISASVAELDQKLTSLQGSALTDSDLAGILSEISDLETAVESIDNTAIETEVADLNTEIDSILEKLGDLLAANAFYEGNLTITNLGQLANVQELMKTGADDPTVTVKGSVLITVTSANGLKDSIASVNLILSKIRAVQGTVTVTSEVDASLPALTYATGDVDFHGKEGKAAITADKLLTIDGNMSLTELKSGVVAYPALSSVGDVVITEKAGKSTITTLNLGALTTGEARTGTDSLVLAKATNVHLGGTLPSVVSLTACVDFMHTTGGSQGDLDLYLGGTAATLSLGSTKFTGTVTISTKGNINLPNVTEIATTTLILNTSSSEAHLPAVTKIVGPVDINNKATTVDLSALKTLNSTLRLQGPKSVSLPALEKVLDKMSGVTTITIDKGETFLAPKLSTTSVVIDLEEGKDLTVSISNLADTTTPTNDIVEFAKIKTLTVAAQEGDLDVSQAGAELETLNFTGKQAKTAGAGNQNNSLTITASNTALKTLTIGADSYLGSLSVSGTTITTLSTAGAIVDIDVTANTALETFNFAHTHVQGDNESTVNIVDNTDTALTTIDLSSLSKVGTVTVTGNTSLANLTAPSADVLATSLAAISVTVKGNKLAGTYAFGVEPTGTVTYSAPVITSATLSSFKAWINANINVDIASPAGPDRTITTSATILATGSGVTGNTVSYDLDLDKVDDPRDSASTLVALNTLISADTDARDGADDTNGTDDDDNNGGNITTARELATIAD